MEQNINNVKEPTMAQAWTSFKSACTTFVKVASKSAWLATKTATTTAAVATYNATKSAYSFCKNKCEDAIINFLDWDIEMMKKHKWFCWLNIIIALAFGTYIVSWFIWLFGMICYIGMIINGESTYWDWQNAMPWLPF